MSDCDWKVQTTEGTLVNRGTDKVKLDEEQARKDAERRNKSAEELGVRARYEAVPA